MDKQNNEIENVQISADTQAFALMQKTCNFEIAPCEKAPNLDHYTKLELTSAQKIQVSALMQQIPQAIATGTMAHAYIARFPEGLPHTLITLRQGGFGGMIRADSGKFAGAASFYSLSTQAALMGTFTAMSAVTGQYFLAQINHELKSINQKLDDILGFLYGDKKAELLSELSFVKYAYHSYSSIIAHEQQRIATIASLQQSRKIAMKDIEFYLHDLDNISDSKKLSVLEKSKYTLNCKKCLDLAEQLYVLSSLLEIHYSQNFDHHYLDYVKDNMIKFLDKCHGHLQVCLGGIRAQLMKEKDGFIYKFDKAEVDKFNDQLQIVGSIIDSSANGEKTAMEKVIQSALHAPAQETTYVLTDIGDIYFKKP